MVMDPVRKITLSLGCMEVLPTSQKYILPVLPRQGLDLDFFGHPARSAV